MNISASNIGWKSEYDREMYAWLAENAIAGLEIAPTRIFQESPYEHVAEIEKWAKELRQEYGLNIVSMQSIWFGRSENIFEAPDSRDILLEYTKRAIDFAQAAGCGNLVFGCPRNRNISEKADKAECRKIAEEFFGKLGEYSACHDTVLAMEANPPIYNTNFINTTEEAMDLVKSVNCRGFKLNLDIGTMIHNEESADILKGNMDLINHIHVSEPGLAVIEQRRLHDELSKTLRDKYERYVSLEVKTQDNIADIRNMLSYIKKIFG